MLPPRDSPAAITARTALLPLAPLALLALLALLAPALPLPPAAAITTAFLAAACATLLATDTLAIHPRPARRTTLLALFTAALLAVAGFALAHRPGVPSAVLSGLLASAGVLLGAGTVGARVGERVAHAGHLPAVALASGAADVWSVHSPRGVTHAMVTVADEGLQRLFAVSAAVPPGREPAAMVGGGDVVFAALYLAAARAHGLSRARTALALAVGLCLALGATLWFERPLPALPFMGLCVVAANPPAWRVPRKDVPATLLAVGLFAVAVAHATLNGV